MGNFCEAMSTLFVLSFPAFEWLHAEGQQKLLKGEDPKGEHEYSWYTSCKYQPH